MRSSEQDEFVERVNERTDIYAVVSRYVPLTQKSGRYWGRCPFHSEKTASFSVSPDKGLFYCFGCGAGGNAFKFLSLIENITYYEAIKLQAQRLGIALPEKKYSPEEERRRREEKILLKINELAQEFYHECLIKTARGEIGRKYFTGRGITSETIETFKLGYATDDWDNLLSNLTRQGISPEQLEKVGLIVKRKNSSGYYDRFRSRVMIPINDIFGHTVGFGGRILGKEDETSPKYLNTPETVLFNKGNLLFGLDKSNRAISAAGKAIIVEGYMDAISLFCAGIKNVAATLGTAFTPEHAKLILRYARKIIFCYDSDEAGQRATIRALPIVQKSGAEVFVVKVPDDKDPDEFIRKHGKVAFEELINHAETLIDYRLKYVLTHADLTTLNGRITALREILPVVVKINDAPVRTEYRKKIAYALNLDEQVIIDEWRKFSYRAEQNSAPVKKSSAVVKNKTSTNENPTIRRASETILRWAWSEIDCLDYMFALVSREIFTKIHQEIISWLESCAARDKRADKISAATELSEEANAELARILLSGADEPRSEEIDLFYDSVNVLRQVELKKKYNELIIQAGKYISSDKAAYAKAVQESIKIKRELDSLKMDEE